MPRRNQPTAEGVALLMPYMNNIIGAVEQGLSRPQIWAAVQGAEAEGGPQIAGATIFDMNYVYTRANEVINAQDAFGALDPQDVVSAQSWSWAPWAARTTAAEQNPRYMARYEWLGVDSEGNQVSQWFQTDWDGSIDVLKQKILDQVFTSAQLSLNSYQGSQLAALGLPPGVTVTGIGRVQLLRF